jgi:hypothetical protein
MFQSLPTHFLHHLKSDGTHVWCYNEIHMYVHTPVKTPLTLGSTYGKVGPIKCK